MIRAWNRKFLRSFTVIRQDRPSVGTERAMNECNPCFAHFCAQPTHSADAKHRAAYIGMQAVRRNKATGLMNFPIYIPPAACPE